MWGQRTQQPRPTSYRAQGPEEEETPEDEQRESQMPKDITKDNPILGQPKS